jgi:phage tail sheath protein FI
MTASFLHGVEVLTVTDGTRNIQTVSTSVIGIVGTAPNADPNVFPLNTPVLIAGSQAMLASLYNQNGGATQPLSDFSVQGTLPDAVQSILDVVGAAIVVVRVENDADEPTQEMANVIGGINGETGAYEGLSCFLAAQSVCGVKPRILLAPGYTHQRTVGGVTGIVVGTAGAGYTNGTYPLTITDSEGGTGSGAAATATIANGAVTAVTVTNPGSGYATPTAALPGGAGTPTTPAAFTVNVGLVTNAVIAAMDPIAQRLRAIELQDGTNTTNSSALAQAQDIGSKRVFLVDPWVLKVDSAGNTYQSPASAVVAGVIALMDNQQGWWWSPSNHAMPGIVGTARPIDFSLGDINSAANILNEGNVATIVYQGGWLLWGNRTLSSDQQWQYLCVVRTMDIICDSLQAAMLWAVDNPITKNWVSDVVEEVNNYLRTLTSQGAILGGSCWADPDLNTSDNITNGQTYFDFDFTPAYPAESVQFQAQLTDSYITNVFSTTTSS